MSDILVHNTTETFNITSNSTEEASNPNASAIIIIVYIAIMLISSAGNLLVLAVVYRNESKRMRTTINFFIVNMSCSDLLITFCNIPLAISGVATSNNVPFDGVLGRIYCGVTTLLFYLSIEVSLMSLVSITVDRFLAVFNPFNKLITTSRAAFMIAIIWLVAFGFTTPLAIHSEPYQNQYFRSCLFRNLSWKSFRDYMISGLTVFVVLPLLLMIILYSSIVVKLFRQKTPGELSVIFQEQRNRRNRKVLLMLFIVVTVTTVCWLPYFSVFTACVLADEVESCYLDLYFQILAFANCALNPCVYIIFIESFREGFYRILSSVFCRIKREVNPAGPAHHSYQYLSISP